MYVWIGALIQGPASDIASDGDTWGHNVAADSELRALFGFA